MTREGLLVGRALARLLLENRTGYVCGSHQRCRVPLPSVLYWTGLCVAG